jgi:hypothetical protein
METTVNCSGVVQPLVMAVVPTLERPILVYFQPCGAGGPQSNGKGWRMLESGSGETVKRASRLCIEAALPPAPHNRTLSFLNCSREHIRKATAEVIPGAPGHCLPAAPGRHTVLRGPSRFRITVCRAQPTPAGQSC